MPLLRRVPQRLFQPRGLSEQEKRHPTPSTGLNRHSDQFIVPPTRHAPRRVRWVVPDEAPMVQYPR